MKLPLSHVHAADLAPFVSCCKQVSLQTAKSLQAERAAEQCRDLRAVLNLLIHITQSELSAGDDDDGHGLTNGVAMVGPAGQCVGMWWARWALCLELCTH